MEAKSFKAKLISQKEMDATYIEVPFNVKEVFGSTGHIKVKAQIDGVLYRGIIANMGTGCHILGVTQKIRNEIRKGPGDYVDIVLEEDTDPRVIEVPDDMANKLKKYPEQVEFFNSLSYTNRKEYIVWVESSKKEETRKSRIDKTIEKLTLKLKNPDQK